MKVSEDPRFSQAVQNYEAGLKALQGHKYDKAKAYFEKVVAGPSPELADRASVHLHSCNQQMSRASNTFKTPEEQYDYAVSLMNLGDYVTARENFDSADQEISQAGFHLVRYGGPELPYRPLPRSPQQPGRVHPAQSRQTAIRRATTPTLRTWPTIHGSLNCSILIPAPKPQSNPEKWRY